MKYVTANLRVLALLFALVLILTTAGCGCSREPSSSVPENISEPAVSSDAESENSTEVERVFLIEKIDQAIERNSDSVGWIYIPNMEVDDAVVQRNDPKASFLENLDYYLRLDEDKNYALFGCYYADPRCRFGDRDGLSKNTIIYGHSDYKDDGKGPKFSQLHKYTDIEFLRENPYIFFSTPEEDMVWQIFSVFYTNIDFNYIQANPSSEEFAKILTEAKAKSEYIIDVPVDENDKIITLSTCTGLFKPDDKDNYRYVVMAKLLPTNEATSETVSIEKNPNPMRD